tara:strand:+ start:147 stop:356 length:210 start_codon:yes stop_codon:yes gene_type:complete
MGAVKNHAMGIEEDIFAIPNLETKCGECEVVQEFQDFVVKALDLKTHFDISCAKESATELWNEFWGKYY